MTSSTGTRRHVAGPGRPRKDALPASLNEQRALVRQLKLAKDQERWWRDERNHFVLECYKAGVGVDRIAKAAGVERTTVHTIVVRERRKEETA